MIPCISLRAGLSWQGMSSASAMGHGFEALEEVELGDVKQEPCAGDADKTRFRCRN
ncbi:MAG: hypothetical protein NTW33_10170 [Methanoregula sp.]|nr:hypothetical protein [Methanoregula sp.]